MTWDHSRAEKRFAEVADMVKEQALINMLRTKFTIIKTKCLLCKKPTYGLKPRYKRGTRFAGALCEECSSL